MGGYGSGRPRANLYLGQLLRLDVLRLREHLFSKNLAVLSWRWETGANVGLLVDGSKVNLNYSVTRDGETETVSTTLEVARLPCRYGGVRPLFCCPQCCGRSRFLYLRSGRFVCRRCTGLRYWTQTVDPMGRLDCAIRKLQRKLADPGDDVNNWDLEYFPKPKWMRHRTHERLVGKGLELVECRDAVWMEGAARLLTRLGVWPPNNV